MKALAVALPPVSQKLIQELNVKIAKWGPDAVLVALATSLRRRAGDRAAAQKTTGRLRSAARALEEAAVGLPW